MGTVRISEVNSGPATTFQVEGDLLSQSIPGNYSVVRCYLVAKNGPGGSSGSGYFGAGVQYGTIAGVKEFARRSANPFLPSGVTDGATRWRLGPYDVQVPHNSDGTRAPITFGMVLDYGNISETLFSAPMALPTIPRTSKATFAPASPFDAGTTVRINTNRASSGFTHRMILSFQGIYQTIAQGVGASFDWEIPLSLLEQIPNATSATGFIRTETYSGSTFIGRYDTVFTLRAPASVVPSVSGITAVDQNPDVVNNVGALVQGLSRLKITVAGAGVLGSTIESASATLLGNTVDSGGEVTVAQSGVLPITAAVMDSRGRTGAGSASVTALAYTPPAATAYQARRCNSIGTPIDDGTYLRVDLTAAIASLLNGTQRNALTIRAFTRPRGTTAWTTRNVVTPGGLSYSSWFLVSGGAVFSTTSSYDVRVQVQDRFGAYLADTVVSTASVALDLNGTKVGVGKIWEQGALDVAGQIFQGGMPVIDSGDLATVTAAGIVELATVDEVRAGMDTSRAVTPSALRETLALPDQVWFYGPSAFSLTGGAASWQIVPGATVDITPARDLWVDVDAGAIVKAVSGGGYVMIGVNVSGGATFAPDTPPDGGSGASHWTPFSSSAVDTHISAPVKRLRLPGGVTTTFTLWTRRNVGSGSHACNYSIGSIRPVRWA